tara:strand:- start:21 stop:338 length:318 start_codon:yes stop_codon:yes gene_type:complete
MIELGSGCICITFGEYGSKSHMEISERIKVHLDENLDNYIEDVDYFLFTQRGDDIPNGIDIFNLKMLKDVRLRGLLNSFTDGEGSYKVDPSMYLDHDEFMKENEK